MRLRRCWRPDPSRGPTVPRGLVPSGVIKRPHHICSTVLLEEIHILRLLQHQKFSLGLYLSIFHYSSCRLRDPPSAHATPFEHITVIRPNLLMKEATCFHVTCVFTYNHERLQILFSSRRDFNASASEQYIMCSYHTSR